MPATKLRSTSIDSLLKDVLDNVRDSLERRTCREGENGPAGRMAGGVALLKRNEVGGAWPRSRARCVVGAVDVVTPRLKFVAEAHIAIDP